MKENLGIIPTDSEPFSYQYDDKVFGNKYGVFASHGHEYDILNYEEDYTQTPIGDLITTEIAARLPHTILKHVEYDENLKRNLEEIENVRPYTAIFNWLFYQVKEHPNLKKKIGDALSEIIDNFNNLEYLKKWYKKHDKFYLPFDRADKLQAAIMMFKLLDVESAESFLNIFAKIFGSLNSLPIDNSDSMLTGEASKFLMDNPDYRYRIFGHTHNPLQVPIRILNKGFEQMYLNTGTCRKRYVQDHSGGFMGLKGLSYTIIYSREENPKQLFEAWTGTLKEE